MLSQLKTTKVNEEVTGSLCTTCAFTYGDKAIWQSLIAVKMVNKYPKGCFIKFFWDYSIKPAMKNKIKHPHSNFELFIYLNFLGLCGCVCKSERERGRERGRGRQTLKGANHNCNFAV